MDDITKISIKDYIEKLGISTRTQGGKCFCSSPFARDTNWSFCIYLHSNSYFDFSTGHGGNILNFASRYYHVSLAEAAQKLKEGTYEKHKPNYKQFKEEARFWEEFKVDKYTNTKKEEIEAIEAYARKRGITEGFVPGIYFTRDEAQDRWIRNPALAFVHTDKYGKACGIKFRRIDNETPRFSARGKLSWYILKSNCSSTFCTPPLFIVESESSANSLWMYLKKINLNAIIASRGGVSAAPDLEDFPEKYRYLKKKLIIDYDGNEELYQERLKLYEPLKAQPIKLILAKGEDINSLYCKNKMYLIENLLLQ